MSDREWDAMGWPVEPIWPETVAGKAIVDDYYAADDPRETVGYSLGARLAQVEAEASRCDPERLRGAFIRAGIVWVLPADMFDEAVAVVAREYDSGPADKP